MVARTGSYTVRSRVIDDDGGIYAGTSPRHSRAHIRVSDVFHRQTGSGISSSRKSGERILIFVASFSLPLSFPFIVLSSFFQHPLHTTIPYRPACTPSISRSVCLRVVSGYYPFLHILSFQLDPDAVCVYHLATCPPCWQADSSENPCARARSRCRGPSFVAVRSLLLQHQSKAAPSPSTRPSLSFVLLRLLPLLLRHAGSTAFRPA